MTRQPPPPDDGTPTAPAPRGFGGLSRSGRRAAAMVFAVVALLLVRCSAMPRKSAPDPGSIEACGRRFEIGTRVVSWREPIGYDAYRREKHFTREAFPDGRLRYTPLRGGLSAALQARAASDGLELADLQQIVHQFVIHFDVCGTSRQCFKVLHDVRNLSVHFLLDVDGTIYQTLDLREKAHHSGIANDASIGVEIAHPGAWPQPLSADMRRWYAQDDRGWFLRIPPGIESDVLTRGFVARPDRPRLLSGEVQGRTYYQFDFTPQQYHALARLTAGLVRIFPRIRIDVPRGPDGAVMSRVLPEEEVRRFSGILGHFHVNAGKNDPGPAMQWERLLDDVRTLVDG